jgi:hypothetical protein
VKIKHSKYRNTGLIYELLVKQVTSDLIAKKDSPAISILRKYFSGNNALVKEHKLYKNVLENVDITSTKAEMLISESLKASKRINQKELKDLKYDLISEIKQSYGEDFFLTTVPEYKSYAAFYCLLEAERSTELIDPEYIVNNKVTLLEHMTSRYQSKENVTNSLIKEFSTYDKDLRLLTFKVLLEKFNKKFSTLLPEQKDVLKQFIALGATKKLKDYVNECLSNISTELSKLSTKVPKGIEKIKLNESIKMAQPLTESEKVTDTHLVKVLQFYDLIHELKTL